MPSRAALACLLVLVAGCVLNPIADPQSGLSSQASEERIAISRGDRLRILTRDGRRRMITVLDANQQAVITSRETIPISDLVFVERREFSASRTAAATGGILIVLVLAAGLPTIAFMPDTAPVIP